MFKRTYWNQILIVGVLLLSGCYAIPSYDAYYYGRWNEKATKPTSEAFEGKTSAKDLHQSSKGKKDGSKESNLFSSIFRGKKKKKDESALPNELYSENQFFPPELIREMGDSIRTEEMKKPTAASKNTTTTESEFLSTLLPPRALYITGDDLSPQSAAQEPIRLVGYTESDSSLPEKGLNSAIERWRHQTEVACEALQTTIEQKKARGESTHDEEGRLRLLSLAIDRQKEAEAAGSDRESAITRFWESECRGLAAVLNGSASATTSGTPDFEKAAKHFQTGLDHLKQENSIKIQKAFFVTSPAPFGLYEKKEGVARPGDDLYLYTELDNVVSRTLCKKEHLSIECHWALLDSKGEYVLAPQEQLCNNRSESLLRDIVLNISAKLPKDLTSGTYHFRIKVLDQNSRKPSSCELEIPIQVEK